jgi:RNA polymerase subunit RPABC4/transcription elongation factor Spt4
MAMIKCPECGRQISDAAPTCPQCGVQIAGRIMRCPDCQEVIFKDQEMCPNCHRPLTSSTTTTAREQTVIHNEPVQPRVTPSTTDNGGNDGKIPPETPKKKNHTTLIISFVIALIIVFVGLYFYKNSAQKQKEEDAYENAMQSSEPAVLQDYLDTYKDIAETAHLDSIQSHLDRLKMGDQEWMNAVMSGSKTALQDYLTKHPGSIHEVEAKNKIDSLDWVEVSAAGTPEAYQRYIDDHGTAGSHYDEAQQMVKKMNDMKVSSDDKQTISTLFNEYFTALGERDESGVCSTISSVLNNFLGKHNATKTDVMSFMQKIFKSDINSMKFTVNNDYKIEKEETGDGEYTFNVSFSVDQNIDRSDASKEKFCTYKVKAKVGSDGKISEINMTKIIQ